VWQDAQIFSRPTVLLKSNEVISVAEKIISYNNFQYIIILLHFVHITLLKQRLYKCKTCKNSSKIWKKFRIGTSVSVSGNIACRLRCANEGNTRFWWYFSRHREGNYVAAKATYIRLLLGQIGGFSALAP